jgi:hypothetical protein
VKKLIFILCLSIITVQLSAQKKKEPSEKQKARREKINTLIRQQEEGALVFNKQNVYGIRLNTDGWGVFYEKGYMKNVKTVHLFSLELGIKKHPKEQKINPSNTSFIPVGNPFVYGKQNHFYQLKPTYGQQKMIGGKTNKNGVAVHVVYAGGISLGFERPYYVTIEDTSLTGTREIKYSVKDSAAFLGNGIVQGTGIRKGWNEIKFVPGVHAKLALRFDYGRFNEMVSAIEVGINAEAYARKVNIMLQNPSSQVFFNGYVAIMFGKRK